MKSALDIVVENRAIRELESQKEVKKVVLTAKRSLSERLKGVEMLATRWPHNPMSMNYAAMGITDEELK